MDEYLSSFWAYPDNYMDRLLHVLPVRRLQRRVQSTFDHYARIGLEGRLTAAERSGIMAAPPGFDELNLPTVIRAQQAKPNTRKRDALEFDLLLDFLDFFEGVKDEAAMTYTQIVRGMYPDISIFQAMQRLEEPCTDGSRFDETLQARAVYEAQRLTQMAVALSMQGKPLDIDGPIIQRFLQAEQNWLLKASEGGGHHGYLDTMMTNIVGYCVIRDMERRGIEEVEFVAVMDERTTEACASLHGKVFKVSELVLGKNAPPIYPPPHPCRSVLKPIKR